MNYNFYCGCPETCSFILKSPIAKTALSLLLKILMKILFYFGGKLVLLSKETMQRDIIVNHGQTYPNRKKHSNKCYFTGKKLSLANYSQHI